MVTFEDIDESSYSSDSSSSDSAKRGLKTKDKEVFLKDLDSRGGVVEGANKVSSILDENQPFYGDRSTTEGKLRRKKFKNIVRTWKKLVLAGKFEAVRLTILQSSSRPKASSFLSKSPKSPLPPRQPAAVPKKKSTTPISVEKKPRKSSDMSSLKAYDGSLADYLSDDEEGKTVLDVLPALVLVSLTLPSFGI